VSETETRELAAEQKLSNGPVDDLAISVYDQSAYGAGDADISYDLNPDLYREASGKDIAHRFGKNTAPADSGFPR
jgi:hypothetical protein